MTIRSAVVAQSWLGGEGQQGRHNMRRCASLWFRKPRRGSHQPRQGAQEANRTEVPHA